MLYRFTQLYLRAGFRLFYRKVYNYNLHKVPLKVPVLLVPNHPNGFMDPLVIGAYLPRPTNFLARGDVFNIPFLAPVFRFFNMIPVYRASEGKENIGKNFQSFDASYDAIEKGECLMIFGEGLCENNWELRPMKKGAARIAQRAWTSNSNAEKLVVIPVGLTYSNYTGGGKYVIVNYGDPIEKKDFEGSLDSASFITQINQTITQQLNGLAYFDDQMHEDELKLQSFQTNWQHAENNKTEVLSFLKSNVTSELPEMEKTLSPVGRTFVTLPHYLVCRAISRKLTSGTVFYDSVLFLMFWLLMPVYAASLIAMFMLLI